MEITEFAYIWILIALIIFPINLIFKAPYGKHSTKKWGKTIDNKTGWFLMELPALVTCPLIYFIVVEEISLSIGFVFIWITHYFNRTIIYPLRIKTKGKKIPIAIVASAFFFNLINGFLNGYFISLINISNFNNNRVINQNITLIGSIFNSLQTKSITQNKTGYIKFRDNKMLIESYIELASSNLFSVDPVVVAIKERSAVEFSGKLEYQLADGNIVAINEDTQETLNTLLENKPEIVDYMRESKNNFMRILREI